MAALVTCRPWATCCGCTYEGGTKLRSPGTSRNVGTIAARVRILPPCSSRPRLIFAEYHLQYSETHGLTVDLTSRYPGQHFTVPNFYAPGVANGFRDQDYGRSVLLGCVGGLVNAFVLLASPVSSG